MGNDVRAAPITTFLFTDIESSSRLWEREPERMRPALALHDQIARKAISDNGGMLIKTLGDGVHAAFLDPLNAIAAAVQFQIALRMVQNQCGIDLLARCGLHAGMSEGRDNDFFGQEVNRAARIMDAAHGGQVLLSEAVAVLTQNRLPAGIELRDLGTARLRGLATRERIYQLRHPELREDFPALRSLDRTPNNLPQQPSSFIGRDKVLDEIADLQSRTRLLTLYGAGGIGKTRLSLQAAAATLDSYPDGVWMIELASLSDPRLVMQAIASALGVKEALGRPVAEAVLSFVQDRSLLLVLDNCEHLLTACAEAVHLLLQAGQNIRLLASSREPLHVAGEVTYLVPPLPIPETSDGTPERLYGFDSVRLFVDRAAAARPAFAIDEKNAAAVAEICRRLDGIPLAIELAAARVRSMSAERIASRLSDRLNLLSGGDRTALPRQQTLRALIDWSYDLLDDRERILLGRLAVFAGGFTLEAAEAACSNAVVPESDVLHLLTNLVEKSLIAFGDEAERYYLLDTIREYAATRLDEAHDTKRMRARHITHYLAYTGSRPSCTASEYPGTRRCPAGGKPLSP
jgi:predicted ATPase/class 3 adenylate cyclase